MRHTSDLIKIHGGKDLGTHQKISKNTQTNKKKVAEEPTSKYEEAHIWFYKMHGGKDHFRGSLSWYHPRCTGGSFAERDLQRSGVVVCCSVLQCVAAMFSVCCGVSQVSFRKSVTKHRAHARKEASKNKVFWCVAVCQSVMQCVLSIFSVCCSVLQVLTNYRARVR